MRFTSLAVMLASALAVSAQTTHQIVVGGNGTLTYEPANITAAIGDVVTFVFKAKNHTVSQSLFASPCTQFTNASISDPTKQNLTSGFMFVPANATNFPTWSIQITQTTPFWFFCAQTGHCGLGMVGSINANESSPNTFEAFKAKAVATASGGGGTSTNGTTPSTGTSSGTPTGTSSASAKASSGAATGKMGALNVQLGGGIGAALMGVAFGLML